MKSIMLMLLTKNDARYLPTFLHAIEKLDYPHEALRFVWLYGPSVDNTLEIILDFHRTHDYKYEVYKEPAIKKPLNNALFIADLCNLFKTFHKNEDYVLVMDTDIEELPPNLLHELIAADKDIVAPYIYVRQGDSERFYDTYVFRYNGWTFAHIEEDGKVYNATDVFRKEAKEPVELESVGTLVLIKGEVFRNVNWENPAPFLQFCNNARKQGYKVYALPYVKVYHHNMEDEAPHYPVEYYVMRRVLPIETLEKTGYVKVDGTYKFNGGHRYA